jgi:hypothetical protein
MKVDPEGLRFPDDTTQTTAWTGTVSYDDLDDLPTLFDGAYTSLTSVPSTFAPSTHKSSHATGGADALTAADVGAAASSHSHSWSDLTSGVPTSLSGYGITDAVGSSDARLTDSRTPTAHTHGLGDLTQGGATNGQVIAWSGSAWAPATVSGGGGGSTVEQFVHPFLLMGG